MALEFDGGCLLPYAKPIAVKPGSTDALRDMRTPAFGDADDLLAGDWLIAVGDDVCRPVGAPCVPELVVVPSYQPGHATQLRSLSETEAFVALAVNAVNLAEHGIEAVRALGELVARCECVTLAMSDLDEAVELVRQVVQGTGPTARRACGVSGPSRGRGPCRDGTSAVSLDDNLAIYDDVGHRLILLNVAAAAVGRAATASRPPERSSRTW